VEEAPTMDWDAGICLLRRTPLITRTALWSGWSGLALGPGSTWSDHPCSAGRCGAARQTSRSSLPAPALGWREKSGQARAAPAARRHPRAAGALDRTRSVGRSRAPDIDRSCGTSTSRPAAGWVRRSEMDER
jgi:hypothetical protein